MTHRLYTLFKLSVAIGWTIFLSILLLQPSAQPVINTGVQGAPPSFERELLFSTGHVLTFGFTFLLWCWALALRIQWQLVALCAVLMLYGVLAEQVQSTVPGRSAQWWDMLANGLGVLMAYGAWHAYERFDAKSYVN
ncbi:MAG: VanZ family protein [Chloroflexota bacterium]